MLVHTCCCIGVFVLSGLIQNSKGIQNLFANFLCKLEKKKIRDSSSIPLTPWLLAEGHLSLSYSWPQARSASLSSL